MGILSTLKTLSAKAEPEHATNYVMSTVHFTLDPDKLGQDDAIRLDDVRFENGRACHKFIDAEVQSGRDVKLIVDVPTGDVITSLYFNLHANVGGIGGAYEFKTLIEGTEYLITIGESKIMIEILD